MVDINAILDRAMNPAALVLTDDELRECHRLNLIACVGGKMLCFGRVIGPSLADDPVTTKTPAIKRAPPCDDGAAFGMGIAIGMTL